MRPLHIVAGSLVLMAGYTALYTGKGSSAHRKSGRVFVCAMLIMTVTGAMMAGAGGNEAVVLNALLTAYLVITALTTVSRPGWSPRVDVALAVVALALGLTSLAWGLETVASPTGTRDGLPAFPYFMYGVIGVLAGVGDARMIRAGGLKGAPRLTRHLWRMCWALWIAAASFFWGQAKVIPEPIRIMPLLSVPVLAVVVTMVYWLWRVRIKRSLRGILTATMPEPPRIDPVIATRA